MTAIVEVFLWFIFYSFCGWVYESVLCSVLDRRLVNRGFLNAPVCPVYGFGAIVVILALSWTDNVLILFFGGALLTCTTEYLTGYILEKAFKAKWWDYSHMRFQLHGRVCLIGAVAFGSFALALIRIIHPVVSGVTAQLSDIAIDVIGLILFILLLADTFITTQNVLRLNGRLQEIQGAINDFVSYSKKQKQELKESLHNGFEKSGYFSERVRELLNQPNWHDKRLMRAFPSMRSLRYNQALQKIKERLYNKYKKK